MLETETFDYFDDNLRREYVRNGKKAVKMLGSIIENVSIEEEFDCGNIFHACAQVWNKLYFIGEKNPAPSIEKCRVVAVARTRTIKPILILAPTDMHFTKEEIINILRPRKKGLATVVFDPNSVEGIE